MSTLCMAQASIVSGQTINKHSAGAAPVGDEDSAFTGFRSIVTVRLDVMAVGPPIRVTVY